MEEWRYLIALGSNQPHRRLGHPRAVLQSALQMIAWSGCRIEAVSPLISSRPVGPSQRDYANAAAVVLSALTPHAMLGLLQGIEQFHGRERRGARWRARTLDCDIVLWSGGEVRDPGRDPVLVIPHPRYRTRDFVLGPGAAIAPRWRDPTSNLRLAHLQARLTRPRPLPR